MHRSLLAVFAVTSSLCLAALPAAAGPTENAFLSKLAGNWVGSGSITGGQNGPVSCKLAFKPNGAKLTFSGRCKVEDVGSQSFSGNITYNNATKQYEARSSSSDVSIGVKRGNSVVFTTKIKNIAGTGNSVMTVAANRISIDVDLVEKRSGDQSKSHVVFSK